MDTKYKADNENNKFISVNNSSLKNLASIILHLCIWSDIINNAVDSYLNFC